MSLILWGIIGSTCAGLATGLGALAIFFIRKVNYKLFDGMLGFAAGVMLSASFFSLIIPALDFVQEEQAGSKTWAATVVSLGIILGVATIWILHNILPHEHEEHESDSDGNLYIHLNKVLLFILAITIHNFPEGMAVGVAFGTGDILSGMPIAIGIGLQNIPEGLAVALALVSVGYKKSSAFLIALCTGLVEPVGGLLGVSLVGISSSILPWGLAFAAGAMIFIISHEIIPETHKRMNKNTATAGFLAGLLIMMFLDVVLG